MDEDVSRGDSSPLRALTSTQLPANGHPPPIRTAFASYTTIDRHSTALLIVQTPPVRTKSVVSDDSDVSKKCHLSGATERYLTEGLRALCL